ncbi:MAG: universal stress protein [Chitinophagaceae bacterium]|nr:universal stress protein [Chitinophagaceae bacterium]
MITFKHIICPTDLSTSSQESIQYAVKLADQGTSTIHLVHVLDMPFLMDPYGLNYSDVLLTLKAENREKLDQLVLDLQAKYVGYVFTYTIFENHDAAENIIQEAKKHQSDLIVMASHGRKGFDRILMGSVAESVMRMSEIPVMVIKSKPNQA